MGQSRGTLLERVWGLEDEVKRLGSVVGVMVESYGVLRREVDEVVKVRAILLRSGGSRRKVGRVAAKG